MEQHRRRRPFRLAVAVAGFAALAPLARAQPPHRIDNIWDGRAHEPNPAVVEQRERADGLETARKARKEDRETEDIARDLLQGGAGGRTPDKQ